MILSLLMLVAHLGKHPPRVPAFLYFFWKLCAQFPQSHRGTERKACGDGKRTCPWRWIQGAESPNCNTSRPLVQSWAQASTNMGSMKPPEWLNIWIHVQILWDDPGHNKGHNLLPSFCAGMFICYLSFAGLRIPMIFLVLGSWTTRTTSPSSLYFYFSLPSISAWINAWVNG